MPIALSLAWLLIAAPPPDLPLTLAWDAPDECPQADEVRALVGTALQQRPPRASPHPLDARARVRRSSAGAWTLRLELATDDHQRTRVLQADECPLLARAAALVVAIQLDPRAPGRTLRAAALREPEPAAPPSDPLPAPVPPAPAPLVPPAPIVPPVAAPPRPRVAAPADSFLAPETPAPEQLLPPARLTGHLRLEGGLELGLLPGAGGLAGLVGGLELPGVRLELALQAAPLRAGTFPAGTASARLDRLAAALRVCPGWTDPRARVTIAGCLGGELGAIHAVGVDVTDGRARWAPWLGLSLGPALRVRLAGAVGLRLGVEGVAALARPSFTVGPTEAALPGVTPVGLRVNLAIDLQFVARKR